jgi:aspartate/methionine/tyrosine aminotransferase
VVHLEIGEPDFDTPSHVIEAAVTALHAGYTHYSPSPGIPELRECIARNAGAKRGLSFGADQVVVTPGGKPIMFFVLLALAEEGDEVIYPNPGFPIYESMIDFVGAKAVPIALHEENQFRLDVDELETLITPRTRLIIINSPQNPTGGVLERSDVRRIAELAVQHDLLVLSDEIYCDILYEGQHVTVAEFPGMAERTIILDGFSKAYAMTGWRMGYGIMPTSLVPAISRLVTNSVSCTATFVQRAGLAALDGPQDEVRSMVAEFRRRRQVIVDGLNAIPRIRCAMPSGAFYVFPYVGEVGLDCRAFADYLLNDAGVATLAGTSFGKFGEGYLRLSYANSIDNLNKALNRIGDAVRRLN